MEKRQRFLEKEFYLDYLSQLVGVEEFWASNRIKADSESEAVALKAKRVYRSKFQILLLKYTSGEPLESLADYLEEVIRHAEICQRAEGVYAQIDNIALLAIDDYLDEYEEFVQTVSLCILLGRIDLLKRFVTLQDSAGYAGTDTLYEDLLKQVLPGRHDVDQWFHTVYDPLIKSVYSETKEQAANLLSQYCRQWYAAFEGAPWYDSHLLGEEGNYYGYWAFEAAAIAYLYDVDDSLISSIVYPRDLVMYARAARP